MQNIEAIVLMAARAKGTPLFSHILACAGTVEAMIYLPELPEATFQRQVAGRLAPGSRNGAAPLVLLIESGPPSVVVPWEFWAAVVSALGLILVAGVTAVTSLRSRIRFRAWREVWDRKRVSIDEILDCATDFHHIMEICSSLAIARRFQIRDYGPTVAYLFEKEWPGEAWRQSRTGTAIASVLPNAPPDPLTPEMENRIRAALDQASVGLFNVYNEKMRDVLYRWRRVYNRLHPILREPPRARYLYAKAGRVYRELFGHPNNPAGYDYEAFYDEWRDLLLETRNYFREEIQRSSRSLQASVGLRWPYWWISRSQDKRTAREFAPDQKEGA